ncbi:MAG: hypothetical protein V5A46_00920 [Haloferacaceae archaeon]
MYGYDGNGAGDGASDGVDAEELLDEFAELDGEEAADRAYELGVADACDPGNRSRASALAGLDSERALRRLKETGETTYDRSLIDLAYNEGRTRAMEYVGESDGGDDAWGELVGDGDATVAEPEPFREALPGALSRLRTLEIDAETGPPESLSLPDFLGGRRRRRER